jgi:Stage II sporulation protein E (SpoIIE)
VVALMLLLAITGAAVAQYTTGRGLIPIAWLSVGPLLAAFAVANSALRTAAQRRLSQVRAVARVAQSALLREVPATVTTGRLASRYVSAAAEARVGGDLLEVVPDAARPRWLIGDTRGKGLPAVRLASVAMTSFRDACAQPGLCLLEIARVVDRSVTRAAGDEDFVTAVFAELDRYFRLEYSADTLRHPDLQAAVDGLLGRLLAHTRRKLDDDVALLLLEATSPVPYQPRRPDDRDQTPASPAGLSLAGTGAGAAP